MAETVKKTATGAILYDKSIINQISERHFDAGGWPHAEAIQGALRSSGRGATMFVGNVPRQFVLRHYLRGGLIGKVVRDRYVFSGADETRSFKEWRLLHKLAEKNLRVPRPAAARYKRSGTFYTADIITVSIPTVVALSEYIAGKNPGEEFWRSIGAAIQIFHRAGAYHADMNAYNLQVDSAGLLWMLDFDKGRLRPPGPWQQVTLSRLHRSLQKILALDPTLNFREENWEQLLAGYFSSSRSS